MGKAIFIPIIVPIIVVVVIVVVSSDAETEDGVDRGPPPSVAVFVVVVGGRTIPDPAAAAERVRLNIAPFHPDCIVMPVLYITIINVLPSAPPPLPSIAASRPC